MWQKILDFFRRLFGGGRSTTPVVPTANEPNVPLPEPEVDEPQDGSEITADTLVMTTDEQDPIIVVEAEQEPPLKPDPIEEEDEDTPVIPDMGTDSGGPTEPDPEPEEEPTEVVINQPVHQARFLWCLDNGHGKQTKGKRSPKLADGRRLFEYEFNRDIVKRISEALDDKGVQYFNVVPEVDVDNFLEGRVKRANKKQSKLPKLFVSIHANAAPAAPGKWSAPHVDGIETWFFHNSRKGRKLASIFQKHLIDATGWKNRHIKSRPSKQFYVLKNTRMTAVLTENGFYNNKKQCLELFKDSVRQEIADAHVKAIMEVEEKGI